MKIFSEIFWVCLQIFAVNSCATTKQIYNDIGRQYQMSVVETGTR